MADYLFSGQDTRSLTEVINDTTGYSGLDEAFKEGILLTTETEDKSKWANIAILFDYIQDESSTVEADITDNWVESNWAYQDHIAIKPRVYRIHGCVGEIYHPNISNFLNKLDDDTFKEAHPVFQKTREILGGVSMLSGTVSNYTRAAMNVVKQIESSYDRYKQIFDNFTKANQIKGKRQKVLYEGLVWMMQSRYPVKIAGLAFGDKVNLQYHPYDNLFFIQSVSARQGDNAFISDIEITIKEVRIAQTKTTKVDKSKFGGFVASQKVKEATNGLAKGEEVAQDVAQDVVLETADKIKEKTKETLKGNPVIFDLVKSAFNGLKTGLLNGAFRDMD